MYKEAAKSQKNAYAGDFAGDLLVFLKRHHVGMLLFIAILFSLYTHWMVLREFHMPTYGNTMIHIASARHVIEKGEYPLIDYSYGGGIPNLYVPAYRMLVANSVLLTGLSLDFTSRLIVLLFGIMVPAGMFILARKLFGNFAGLLAAFLSVLPGELLIYTVRPLPQAMGLILLPVAFHAFYVRNYRAALLLAFAVTMVHQEAIAFLVGGVGMYFGFIILHILWQVLNSSNFDLRTHSKLLKFSLAVIFLSLVSYLAWQFVILGHINVFELAQFKNHEGNVVSMDSYILKTGVLVSAFSLVGLFVALSMVMGRMLSDLPMLSEELKYGFRAFFAFLLAAFGTFFVLSNFSLSRGTSLISISFPFFLGPLAGNEIVAISIAAGLFGAFMAKHLIENSKNFLKFEKAAHLFVFALFAAGFFAVKNDAIGLRVFMDRFLVYLQLPLILLAALGIYALVEFLNHIRLNHLIGENKAVESAALAPAMHNRKQHSKI